MFSDDPELTSFLTGASKSLTSLPTQRRQAIQFRYTDIPSEHSMRNLGAFVMPVNAEKGHSSVYRSSEPTPSDSWEIERCVGMAMKKIVIPHWSHLQGLGRALVIFKVHKEPQVCEMFFMLRDEVIKTYKDTMPKNLEWVHLYNPATEVAFWAELYQPSKKTGRGSSLYTDELCGGFGSRRCMVQDLQALRDGPQSKKQTDRLRVVTGDITNEERRELTRQAQTKLDKAKRKREKQKERKRAVKAEEEEKEKLQQAEMEVHLAAGLSATRIPAPHLKDMTFLSASEQPLHDLTNTGDDSDSDSDSA
eukprot:TRINITY_DN88718_c0_g1_i1.p1 TRINITY_DN88718_c0_g1~~TRINITY_DN88718_c0_g1_i1.p1  ORF type:complete len:306 (-),score=48.85 TRINITY_DN88718_c0_g1_i1:8-925(-)